MMKRMRILILLCLFSLLPATGGQAADVHTIMAVVNGEIITSYDFQQRWSTIYDRIKADYGDKVYAPNMQEQIKQLKSDLLEQMVNEMIFAQEATRMGIMVSDEEIDDFIRGIKRDKGLDEEAYQRFLQGNGMTEEELRRSIRDDLLKRRMVQSNVASRIVVTDKEIEEEYARRTGLASGGTVRNVTLSVIMAPDQEAMDVILQALDDGMSFADAANEYSIGPAVGSGGDLGLFAFNDLAEPWRKALQDVEEGEISEPFEADDKVVLLQVTHEADGDIAEAMDERTRSAIFEELRRKKFDTLFEEFMELVRERAVVEFK
ncbi:MAG: SurA N-terminal domain-containing protein [Desulfovibrio sp.]|jgi:peptidyl-prolyl cis-trans isomerase SurA|nr:SurA N-terminal domain-containing protein [Desulfovibrio sp.]